jgi:uroporphyrinogen-III decarboxylase
MRLNAVSTLPGRCEAFCPGGGFVFNTVHNILARTPVDNITPMIQSVEKFRVT